MSIPTRFRTRRRSTLAVLVTAALSAALALTGATAASAETSDGIDPVGPCYRPPRICLSFDGNTRTFTAFSWYEVGPTPFYLSIFNLSTGERLAVCGSGMSCQSLAVRWPPRGWCHDVQAYIGDYSSTPPPGSLVSRSSIVTYCGPPL
jgi:hypothetical protein